MEEYKTNLIEFEGEVVQVVNRKQSEGTLPFGLGGLNVTIPKDKQYAILIKIKDIIKGEGKPKGVGFMNEVKLKFIISIASFLLYSPIKNGV